jgi:hypothetical protein
MNKTFFAIPVVIVLLIAGIAAVTLHKPSPQGYLNHTRLENELRDNALATTGHTVTQSTCIQDAHTTTFKCGVTFDDNERGVLTVNVSDDGHHYLVTNAQ